MDRPTPPTDLTTSADWFLAYLIERTLNTDAPLALTLSIGGTIVTGHVIGEEDYFIGLHQAMSHEYFGQSPSGNAVHGANLLHELAEASVRTSDQQRRARALRREIEAVRADARDRALGVPIDDTAAQHRQADARDEGLLFIHLKDAHIMQPGLPPLPSSGPGLWWRCRADAVTGFSPVATTYVPPPAPSQDA